METELREESELATLLTILSNPEEPDERVTDLYTKLIELKKKIEEQVRRSSDI